MIDKKEEFAYKKDKMNGVRKKIVLILLSVLILIFISSSVFADNLYFEGKIIPDARSNASLSAKGLIIDAQNCIVEIETRGLKVSRVNESLQQALQLYSAQIALEQKGSGADYKLVNQSAVEVCTVRDVALKAQDEFLVFNESYTNSINQFDLSSMNGDYVGLIKSFDEERFEDSVKLIDKCYTDLSNLESSQTSFRLYYSTTTKTIKDFFVNNWKSLSSWTAIIIILLIVFWKTLKRRLIKRRIDNLYIRKKSVNELIKKMQYEYFKTKKMSEMEYTVKLRTFSDLLRDIERQIPEMNEKLAKIGKEKEEVAVPIQKKVDKLNEKIAKQFKSKVYKRRKTR